jgi:hypothetical protein
MAHRALSSLTLLDPGSLADVAKGGDGAESAWILAPGIDWPIIC